MLLLVAAGLLLLLLLLVGVFAYHVYRIAVVYEPYLAHLNATSTAAAALPHDGHSDCAVTRELWDQQLAVLRQIAQTARLNGDVTPLDTVVMRVNRESSVLLGGGRAALLQLAHPYVAVGVFAHSDITTNGVQARFFRTFENLFAIMFGANNAVFAAARRVRRLHERVEGVMPETVGPFVAGSKYSAQSMQALYWVHATLVESAVVMHEMLVEPLTPKEKDDVLEQAARHLPMFGRVGTLPQSWDEFLAYNRRMWQSETLTVGTHARKLKGFLFTPPHPVFAPFMGWIEQSTAAMMPARIREQFGLRFNTFDKCCFYATHAFIRMVYSVLPGSMRYFHDYLEMERALGRQRMELPSRLSMSFAKFVLAAAMPPRSKMHAMK